MKKLFTTLFMFLAIAGIASAQQFETAREATQKMKIGWNLGNTLDSHSPDVTDPEQTEILRGQPKTTQELMQMMRLAGFNAIRVPVTWYPHLDEEGTIDPMWMARVREVVDYVIDEGMYCIIDLHHDSGKSEATNTKRGWIRASMANYNENHELFEKIWTQIATEFRDYGELLIFEGYNELLDNYDSYGFASSKTSGGYNAAVAADAYAAVNAYAKAFVETVRVTGGNNTQRNLIVNTYAAAAGYGIQNDKLKAPIENMGIPEESRHIIVGVHLYPNIETDGSDLPAGVTPETHLQSLATTMINNLYETFSLREVPVIISELNTSNVDKSPNDYDVRRQRFLWFMDMFIKETQAKGMPCFYWMGLSNKEYRAMPAFNQPELAEKLLKAAYGESYQPDIITEKDYSKNHIINISKVWGEIQLAYNASGLQNTYKGIELEIEDVSSIGNGQLTWRTYKTTASEPRSNELDIKQTTTSLDFDNLPSGTTQIVKVTIVWRTSGRECSFKIKRMQLIRRDGTKEDCTLTNLTTDKVTIAIEAKPNYALQKINETSYATLYYSNLNLKVPKNTIATAYNVVNNQLNAVKTYTEGTTIPPGTGVVISGEANSINYFAHSEETGEEAVGSMLRGSDENEMTTGGDFFYMLSLDNNSTPGTVGFYYAQPNGAPFINKAHKAYLALPANTEGIERYLLSEATSINTTINTATDNNTEQWMTIDGRKLNKKPTRQGLYIHNGQKIAVR